MNRSETLSTQGFDPVKIKYQFINTFLYKFFFELQQYYFKFIF
jgi:hypothetical protein